MKLAFLKLSRTKVCAYSPAQTKVYATRVLVFCVIVYQCLGLTAAQDPVRPPETPAKSDSKTDSSPTVYTASFEDYKIGPSDVIEIKIANAPELSGTYAVSATGAILMPFLGAIT